jgi:3-oxoacyl-[acyl-carrier-protein] synthase II
MTQERPSIVMTGIGVVGACGVGAQPLWDALCAGRSGIGSPTRYKGEAFPCALAAEVPQFSAKDFMPKGYRKAIKVMARDIEIAVACAQLAVTDAGLTTRASEGAAPSYAPERVGCQIGAGLISAETSELSMALATATTDRNDEQVRVRGGFDLRAWGTVATEATPAPARGMENLQPLWMLKYLPNMLACHVTIIHGFEGPSNTITCAEASGLLSIGEGTRVIERGAADACISGSAESRINLMAVARMTLAERLCVCEPGSDALSTVRPFAAASDSKRGGGVPGEAGGLVMLEREERARARGAPPSCRVLGFGSAHAVAPLSASSGGTLREARVRALANAARSALRDAGKQPQDIDLCVAQGLGVASSDETERGALESVFGPGVPPVVALGHVLGDCAAGNGGLQAAIAGLVLRRQQVPEVLLAHALGGGAGGPAGGKLGKPVGGEGIRNVLVLGCSLAGQQAALVLGRA